ncbi:MAG: glutathione S-transferase [Rubritepida sp.]|nr:glutathione S-transferase [Rubritepida sp.]
MKLHWSPRSPFVRKVMVAAHELGLADRIGTVRTVVGMEQINDALLADNPLNKIPTLVLDDGRAIFDSLVICEYLDEMAGGALFAGDKWEVLTRHALLNGLLDLLILFRHERTREKPAARILFAFGCKTQSALGALRLPPAGRLDIGDITLAVALSYLDFRFDDIDWRGARPELATWHAAFCERPSMVATTVVDA